MDSKSNTGANDTVPLLEPQPELQQPNIKRFGYGLFLAFLFLNHYYAQYISQRNINLWDIALVTSCYIELILLLICCLKMYENLNADSPTEDRDWLKGVIWVLGSLFTCTFTWKISQTLTLPWYMNIIIWGMVVSLVVVGFYFFFLFQTEGHAQLANKDCKLDTDDKEEKKFSELSAENKV